MKKSSKLIAAVLCLIMVIACFSGCTINMKVDVSKQGGAAQQNTPQASQQQSETQAPQASQQQSESQAPQASQQQSESQAPANPQTPAAPETPATPETPAAPETPASSNPSSKEEIVAEYIKVYNTTKATGSFVGNESMNCDSVEVDGKNQGALSSLANQFMKSEGTGLQLPPYSDSDPSKTCLITAADIQTAEYKDNGDGTATIKLVPNKVANSKRFQDAQGKMFNVMEDSSIAGTLASIPVLTWSEGDANSNVKLREEDGYCEVTYNKDTKMMTKANYVLVTYADVTHANVLFFKDKSATAKFVYTVAYGA